MGAALVVSLVFTLAFAPLAAKSRQAEKILIPAIDILQSVPVLGFLSISVTGFIALFPGRLLGVECAAIFAIFTSQAWNMTFSFYQSLRTVPAELIEAAQMYRLSAWQRFWRLEVPYRDAEAGVEHDDVVSGRLVLRRRLGSDHGVRPDDHAAGRRLLHRGRDRRSATSPRSAMRSWPC